MNPGIFQKLIGLFSSGSEASSKANLKPSSGSDKSEKFSQFLGSNINGGQQNPSISTPAQRITQTRLRGTGLNVSISIPDEVFEAKKGQVKPLTVERVIPTNRASDKSMTRQASPNLGGATVSNQVTVESKEKIADTANLQQTASSAKMSDVEDASRTLGTNISIKEEASEQVKSGNEGVKAKNSAQKVSPEGLTIKKEESKGSGSKQVISPSHTNTTSASVKPENHDSVEHGKTQRNKSSASVNGISSQQESGKKGVRKLFDAPAPKAQSNLDVSNQSEQPKSKELLALTEVQKEVNQDFATETAPKNNGTKAAGSPVHSKIVSESNALEKQVLLARDRNAEPASNNSVENKTSKAKLKQVEAGQVKARELKPKELQLSQIKTGDHKPNERNESRSAVKSDEVKISVSSKEAQQTARVQAVAEKHSVQAPKTETVLGQASHVEAPLSDKNSLHKARQNSRLNTFSENQKAAPQKAKSVVKAPTVTSSDTSIEVKTGSTTPRNSNPVETGSLFRPSSKPKGEKTVNEARLKQSDGKIQFNKTAQPSSSRISAPSSVKTSDTKPSEIVQSSLITKGDTVEISVSSKEAQRGATVQSEAGKAELFSSKNTAIKPVLGNETEPKAEIKRGTLRGEEFRSVATKDNSVERETTAQRPSLNLKTIANGEAQGGSKLASSVETSVNYGVEFRDESTQKTEIKQVQSAEINVAGAGTTRSAEATVSARLQPVVAYLAQQNKAGSRAENAWIQQRIQLEEGQAVQIGVRKLAGQLQVNLGSFSPDMQRFLQQHIQDIRHMLEQQMDVQVNVNLEGSQQEQSGRQDTSAANGLALDSSSLNGFGEANEDPQTQKNNPVRRFGFNKSEWTG